MWQEKQTIMEELFNKYTAAFDAFNPYEIADLYRMPCAISDADGVQTFTDRKSLAVKFSANCKAMQNFGYQKAKFNILNIQTVGSEQCAVNVGWRIETLGSNIDFRTLYICHQINHAWQIFNANVYQGSFSSAT